MIRWAIGANFNALASQVVASFWRAFQIDCQRPDLALSAQTNIHWVNKLSARRAFQFDVSRWDLRHVIPRLVFGDRCDSTASG